MTVLRSVDETAKMLGLSASTLNKWRVSGDGPQFCRLGRRVVYREEDLDAFIMKGVRKSTSAA